MLRIQRTDVMVHRVVLLLQGYIVVEWAELLERECEELIRSGLRVVLDLSEVAFIGDSSDPRAPCDDREGARVSRTSINVCLSTEV